MVCRNPLCDRRAIFQEFSQGFSNCGFSTAQPSQMDDRINLTIHSLEDNRIGIAADRNGKDFPSIQWMLRANLAVKFINELLLVLTVHHRPRVKNSERL